MMGLRMSGLGSVLFSKSRLAVLALLYLNADQRFYLRQIVNTTGMGMGAVQGEVRTLTKGGLILREREGRQVYYQANRQCPIFEELKAILVKTAGLADVRRIASVLRVNRPTVVTAIRWGEATQHKEDILGRWYGDRLKRP